MAAHTFLFTDIEGSTRLWEDQPDEMKRAVAAHDELLSEVVAGQGGEVFKHTGDGVAAVFDSARGALDAAAGIQRAVADAPFDLRIRVGIHAGEAEQRDGDYFGPALNRTARLMAAAHGGQVLVSLVAVRLAEASDAELVDLGEHRLRDLGRPERVFQLRVEGGAEEFPPIRTLEERPHNLPVLTTSFVGRDQELAELDKLIRGSRLVTVTGVGGSGKTRLALHAAADLLPGLADGAWLVELAAVTDPDLVDDALVAALGVTQTAGQSPREAALEHLADRQALVVVDNCEHLIGAAADLVADVLSHAPGVRVVATSRELLGVPGEVTYGLRSMALPPKDPEPSQLAASDAVRLFVERAAASRPEFRITSDTASHVVEICRRLDGMPLAIELAAARLRSFGPAQIADLLDQRFRLLTGGSRTALPRQQTLTATIEWSYRLLDEPERVLFRRLAVFQGGFDLDAAQEVCGTDPLDPFDVIELLPHLVDKSLVVADTEGEDSRYRLLETIRQFARDRLDETDEGPALRDRHLAYYRDRLRRAQRSLRSSDEPAWTRWVWREADNLRQAIRWGMEGSDEEALAELVACFGQFSYLAGRWSEGLEWIDEALPVVELAGLDDRLRLDLLLTHGGLLFHAGDLEATEQVMAGVVAEFRRLDDAGADFEVLREFPRALNNYAMVLFNSGKAGERNERYSELVTEMLEVARRIGDRRMEAGALSSLAHHRDPEGDPEEARALFEEAEAVHRELGAASMTTVSNQRAHFELHQGEIAVALRYFERGVAYAEEAESGRQALLDRVAVAACEVELGEIAAADRFTALLRELFADPDERASTLLWQTFLAFRAGIDRRRERWASVAMVAGMSERLAEEDGQAVRWDLVDHFERAKAAARDALGEDRFAELVGEGRTLSHDEVVEFLTSD